MVLCRVRVFDCVDGAGDAGPQRVPEFHRVPLFQVAISESLWMGSWSSGQPAPLPSGAILESSGAVLESSGAVLEGPGATLERSGAMLEGPGAVLESSGVILESSGAMPESSGVILEGSGAVQEPALRHRRSHGSLRPNRRLGRAGCAVGRRSSPMISPHPERIDH